MSCHQLKWPPARAQHHHQPHQTPKSSPPSAKELCLHPMPITSSSIPNLPSIIEPELAVPMYALPEWINHPGGHKDYKCQTCAFQHTNRDCMLTHIWQHLEISVGCPMCCKGFQNVASLHQHGQKVHSIRIVEAKQEKKHYCLYQGGIFLLIL